MICSPYWKPTRNSAPLPDKIGKRGIVAGITTTNTYDDSDFVSVTIDSVFAKQSIAAQREKVEKALAEYGVVIKG